ncbi:unnamed protein product [Rotaria sordida]|uniref:Uncharacterized protein n=1 Tax=Rotaria sordida TaxID=392033 RepID=A0A815J7N4_9BILA|nr:unnamed protein product [Rotaria sordida]
MANGCCRNDLCIKKETQLHLALLREELLTNFNTLLIDRIRFLEQTINRLSLISSSSSSTPTNSLPILTDTHFSLKPITINQLTPPLSSSLLRRSSSAGAAFLQNPIDLNLIESEINARSYPSSVDLSNKDELRKRFLSTKKFFHRQNRTSLEYNTTYLSIPIYRQWTSSTVDLPSSTIITNEKGRLESRRFACDVDDNDVRAFKAMVYMEQARKQHIRPLTRLRQVLGISSNSNTGNLTLNNLKKQTNF